MTVSTTNGSASSSRARGYLGHQLPARVRAALAAEHYEQGRPIASPTLAQVAFCFRVPLTAVQQARNGHKKTRRSAFADHLSAMSAKSVSMSDYEVLADDALVAALARIVGSERLLAAAVAAEANTHNGG
jgi:hypothetical protein